MKSIGPASRRVKGSVTSCDGGLPALQASHSYAGKEGAIRIVGGAGAVIHSGLSGQDGKQKRRNERKDIEGVYRPWRNCLMNNLHKTDEFCPVCSKAIVDYIDFLCK